MRTNDTKVTKAIYIQCGSFETCTAHRPQSNMTISSGHYSAPILVP